MSVRAIKIDELTIGDHHYLTPADNCYYLMEYITGDGYQNPVNNLIYNFKKSVDKKGTPQWVHKGLALRAVANYFKDIYVPMIDFKSATIVPIPPSKCKEDPLYDDRMTRVLKACCPAGSDVRDLILTRESHESSHSSGDERPKLSDIQNNLMLDGTLLDGVKKDFILFDDVITGGTHFTACKNLLLEAYPEAKVYGMFIARRALPPSSPLFDFGDW